MLRAFREGAESDLQEALAACDDAIRRNPDFAHMYVDRGGVKVCLGQYTAAFADYDQALLFNPNIAEEIYRKLGVV